MSVPLSQLICDEFVISAKKNELHIIADAEMSAICSLQRGTRQDCVLVCGKTSFDQLPQTFQPWPPVLVRQRNALPHLVDVRLRMEIVGFIKPPTEFFCERLTDGRFSCTRDTKNDYDHVSLPVENNHPEVSFALPVDRINNAVDFVVFREIRIDP
jgi:hypothetical protein